MILAPFCAVRYIIDAWYLPEDEGRVETQRLRLKKMKVESGTAAVRSIEDPEKQQPLQVARSQPL